MAHSRFRLTDILFLIVIFASACSGGGSSGDASVNNDSSYQVCDPSNTGLTAPLPACSSATPCTRIAPELAETIITEASQEPVCDSNFWTEKQTQNVGGFTRYACIYRPSGTSVSSKRPLVLWFHPGGDGSADLLAEQTRLLEKADQFDLAGDVARPGFVLAAIQGRNLRFPTLAPRDGRHHDFYFRDLTSPSGNPDIANADQVIDTLVAEGMIEADKIFVMGWSNGAFFAQMYAIARHETPTPGGYQVAAATVFGAGDPFNDIRWDPFNETEYSGGSSCQLTSYPVSAVPLQIVYRSCDAAVGCDAQQQSCFNNEPGYATQPWLSDSGSLGFSVQGELIGGLEDGAQLDERTASCSDIGPSCLPIDCSLINTSDECLCLVNHLRWPDAAYDSAPASSAHDLELDMLAFLRDNSL